ncbi:hypothetical protein Hamer_G007402 [Homarus americanus]|uniref:Uncharacterized protein n=1 Tax=Homarus americanus TaxID=6706 RepID=A0A8J5JPP2_HOMAM|nr:hypothetical protein Hamer_G007402 [Homarus americanus]
MFGVGAGTMVTLVMGGAVAERFIGSVVEEHKSKSTGPHPPGVQTSNNTGVVPGASESSLDSYIIIVAVVSTIFPLICLILSLVIAR